MRLLTKEQIRQLQANGRWNHSLMTSGQPIQDFRPIVKLVCVRNWSTWLLSEISAKNVDRAFGLFNCGCGVRGFGHTRISKLEKTTQFTSLRFERDLRFKSTKSLNAYWRELQLRQRLNIEQKCMSPQCITIRRRRLVSRSRLQKETNTDHCAEEDDPSALLSGAPSGAIPSSQDGEDTINSAGLTPPPP